MKYCQHCGAENNYSAIVCVKCGRSTGTAKKIANSNSKFFFISSVASLVLGVISLFVAGYLNSTQLSGNASAILYAYGDYASIRGYELRQTAQQVFAYGSIVLLLLGLTLLVIGIIQKKKSK